MQIIRDHQDQPKQSAIEIATLEGETLYEADLLERAAAEGHRALAS
ncbi:hypothetical protein ACFQI3_01305 [Hansschlegelia quercus]|nr:hypothetical protein [Hansschlegelia quercus]